MNNLPNMNGDRLKKMSFKELTGLSETIRQFLLEKISKTGGHLSSNLGVVELTIALHKTFNLPQDKVIFDVGHQSYVHKILSGRSQDFDTLRKYQGLSGYQKRSESLYDPWEAGHSSTSISAALGLAVARDVQKQDHEIIAVIGDGALTGGMALEALNDLGTQGRKVIIVFNDNNMSISPNGSGMTKSITQVRTSGLYRTAKKDVHQALPNNGFGKMCLQLLHQSKEFLKDQIIQPHLFESFNVDYLGPIDGHDITKLCKAFETAKEHKGPIVVHVLTQKGKGYVHAEKDETGAWHGIGPFDLVTGKPFAKKMEHEITWSEVISKTLQELAREDEKIVAITPAMATGSKLLEFASEFPDRFIDCNIAEEHAMTMAAGMAQGGIKPFVSIYSSFLQRAYDQVSHDIARMDLPVVVGVDRAGLVGEDGDTHQGIYDIAFLRTIPGIILSQPKDAQEARGLLKTAFDSKLPWFIRYPRGVTHWQEGLAMESIPVGSWTYQDVGIPESIVIAYGPDVDKIVEKARNNQMNVRVVNARFFKPIDEKLLKSLFSSGLPITVYETDSGRGGLFDAILKFQNDFHPEIDQIALPPAFIPHGSIPALRKAFGISMEDLFAHLENKNERKTG